MSGLQLQIKSKSTFGVTCLPKILYQKLDLSRFSSSAGAHPKNVASDNPLYGDINVLSAVKTIFGLGISILRRLVDLLILNLAGMG
jgi:hypothetical protein